MNLSRCVFLACGSKIDVNVTTLNISYHSAAKAVAERRLTPPVWANAIEGGELPTL